MLIVSVVRVAIGLICCSAVLGIQFQEAPPAESSEAREKREAEEKKKKEEAEGVYSFFQCERG